MIKQFLRSHPRLFSFAKKVQAKLHQVSPHVGYEIESWSRIEEQKAWRARIAELQPNVKECAEISPGNRSWIAHMGWKSYTPLPYPDFDICDGPADRAFDVVVADQVWEHLQFPYRAAGHVHAMLRDGGWFVIGTPFLIRIHPEPGDFTRWTPDGLRQFLIEAGFAHIEIGAWGNRACVKASLNRWPSYGWHRSLRNEWDCPVTVWAFARK